MRASSPRPPTGTNGFRGQRSAFPAAAVPAKIFRTAVDFPGGPFVEELTARSAGRTRRSRDMAQYLVLIYEDEKGWQAGGEAAEAGMKAHQEFGQKYASVLRGGAALQATGTATTIREGVVTDGPFIESKEALGGYYLIEADDLDQALAVAKEVPAPFGGVEVRPLMTFE
jgi:hypothetical protein